MDFATQELLYNIMTLAYLFFMMKNFSRQVGMFKWGYPGKHLEITGQHLQSPMRKQLEHHTWLLPVAFGANK